MRVLRRASAAAPRRRPWRACWPGGAHQQRSACRRRSAAPGRRPGTRRFAPSAGTPSASQRDRLGPHAQRRAAARRPRRRCRRCGRRRSATQVHRRRADEARGERGGRARIQLARRAGLLDAALVQQHHLVGHAHRLGLVVRDVDDGQAELLLQLAQFARASPGAVARRGWTAARPSGRPWPAPPARGPSATRCCWPPDSWPGRRSSSAPRPSSAAASVRRVAVSARERLAHRQAEGDVVGHAEVRKQRVVLEHHRDAALRRRQRRDVAAVDAHRPVLAVSSPAMMRSVVDLPQPEGPSSTQNEPSAMRRSMACSAVVSPQDLEIPASSIEDIGSV